MNLAAKAKGKYVCNVEFAIKEMGKLYIVSEFCSQGTLKDYLEKNELTLKERIKIFHMIC